MMRSLVVAIVLLCAEALALPLAGYAQNALSGVIMVRPAKVELAIAPGEHKTASISVENGTANPLHISVEFEDINPVSVVPLNAESATLLGSSTGTYPLREWMVSPRRSYQLLSGERVEVPITVSVPKGTAPGGRYGSAVIVARPEIDLTRGGSHNLAFQTRIASLFFVRVTGQAKEEGMLEKFGLLGSRYLFAPSSSDPIRFFASFANTGDVHLNPYGRITISPLWGAARDVPVPPIAVYPKSAQTREIVVAENLSAGYYRATLEFNRGYQDLVDERTVWFIIFPSPRSILIVLALAMIAGVLLRKSLRISRNRVR